MYPGGQRRMPGICGAGPSCGAKPAASATARSAAALASPGAAGAAGRTPTTCTLGFCVFRNDPVPTTVP